MSKKYPGYFFLLAVAYVLMLAASLGIVPLEYLIYNWSLLLLLILPAVVLVCYMGTKENRTKLRLITILFLAWLTLLCFMISTALYL
jgi:hypothetical protein